MAAKRRPPFRVLLPTLLAPVLVSRNLPVCCGQTNTTQPSGSPTQSPTASPTTSAPTGSPTRNLEPWNGCGQEIIHRGDKTTICFTIGPDGNWGKGVKYIRFNFQPEADEYSRYLIPDSYIDLVQGQGQDNHLPPGENITAHVASQSSLSFLRMYYDIENERIFPFLTAIIDVKDGVVAGIAWDDACVFCSSDVCLENTYDFDGNNRNDLDEPTKGCYFTKEQCDKIVVSGEGEEKNQCDLQLFVVWTGDDDKGNVMTSSNSRFSAFPPNRLKDAFINSLPDLPDWFRR